MNRQSLFGIGTNLMLVDGMSLVMRVAYSVHGLSSNDTDTGVIYGFLNSLSVVAYKYLPQGIVVCWEGHNNKARRLEIYKGYKASRKEKQVKSDLDTKSVFEQVDILHDFLYVLGVGQVKINTYEADDCIASFCKVYPDKKIVIYTGDKDLLQLVTSNIVWYTAGHNGNTQEITDVNFVQEIGVSIDRFVDFKVIVGDKSDDIPGIMGLGEKTAKILLNKFDLDTYMKGEKTMGRTGGLFEPNASEIVERNRKLIDLDNFQILEEDLIPNIEFSGKGMDSDGLVELLEDYEMWSILDCLEQFEEGFNYGTLTEVIHG